MSATNLQWGSEDEKKLEGKVEIGRHSIDITRSLNRVIRRLRHATDSVMIWADQICINQKDPAEQAAQIRLMSLIYSRALNTVIWLSGKATQDAFNAIYDLEAATTTDFGPVPFNNKDKASNSELIATVFDDPWFQRTWTTQEACLSNDPWLMAGEPTCHWEDCFGMAAVNENIDLFYPTSAGPSSTQGPNIPALTGDSVPPIKLHGFHCAIAIWELKHAAKDRLSLLDTLVKTRHTQAKLPHDKIYGIMGLFANDIVPNYSMKITELWRDISLKILRPAIEYSERMLKNGAQPFHAFNFLSCIDHRVDASGDLPSWAVDWSKSRATTSLAYSTSAVGCYNAGQYKVRRGLSIDQTGKILSLQAKVFDEIVHLSSILEKADLEADVSATITKNSALRTCIAHARTIPAQCLRRPPLEFSEFCKVVTAGKDGSGRQRYPPLSEKIATFPAPGCGKDVLQPDPSKEDPKGYYEVLSFLTDAITGVKRTFHNQIHTHRQALTGKHQLTADSLKERSMGNAFQELKVAFRSALFNRRLCWTKGGHLGLVPRFTKQGDKVIVVPGSPVPFMVREVGKGSYHFIGECYIDGIMDGEAFKTPGQGLEDIGLV
jgi:hypothetical protein